jgi:hypothetical protein
MVMGYFSELDDVDQQQQSEAVRKTASAFHHGVGAEAGDGN